MQSRVAPHRLGGSNRRSCQLVINSHPIPNSTVQIQDDDVVDAVQFHGVLKPETKMF